MQKKIISLAVVGALPPEQSDFFMSSTPDRVAAVWQPLETILDRIETTGEVDVLRGEVVFNEGDGWYGCAQALRDLLDFYELAELRHGIVTPTAVLHQFANKLDSGSPIFEADISKVRSAIAECKRQSMSLRQSQVIDMIDTLRVKREFERIGMAA